VLATPGGGRDAGPAPGPLPVAGIFFSPHLCYYYDCLLLVAVALTLDTHLRRFAPRWRPTLLALAYAAPLLFLESAWIDLGGPGLRLAAVLMVGGMLVMALELARVSARREA